MMKKVLGTMILALAVTVVYTPKAEAVILSFDAVTHPKKVRALGLKNKKSFAFDDVNFLIDTETGLATLKGGITHTFSGEKWEVNAIFDNMSTVGKFPLEDVPADDMFDILLEKGKGKLAWNSVNVSISSLEDDPTYDGPTEWSGKGDPPLIAKRKRVRGVGKVILLKGWLMDDQGKRDDWVYVIENPFIPPTTNPVPEPMTMVLFGSGAAIALARKKFNRS